MMRARHWTPGVVAALCHRLSGIALVLFLPLHCLALGLVLEGAGALDTFLTLTANPFVKLTETGLVVALALHMALGLRILAIECLAFRERGALAIAGSAGFAVFFGLAFLLN